MELLLESFFRHVRDRPQALAVASRGEGRELSFADLEARSNEWVARLRGDTRPLAVAVGNGTAFLEIFLAAWRLGVPAVSMDASGSAAQRRTLCRSLGVARLVDRVEGQPGDGLELSEFEIDAVEPPAGTVLVKLTSGSTGEPLAACFDAPSLRAGIRQIADGMDITGRDRVLLALPLSHSYGFDNGLLSLFMLGTPLFLQPSVYPAELLRAVVQTEATILPLVPPLVRSLSAATWPEQGTSLRRVLCAGGVLPSTSAQKFRRSSGLSVHNFYGSTETGGICFERRPQEASAPGSVGQPLPGVELLFDDLGRVSVRSPANLIGRWGDAARTPAAAVLTGDLGQLGDDGRLRLTGRVANLLNIGGRKIAAVEVEAALGGLEGVREAAVVGVPDEVRGERSVAFLVADRWPVDLRPVASRLRPREVRRVDSLPFTARGKLDRQALRQRAADKLCVEENAPSVEEKALVANFSSP